MTTQLNRAKALEWWKCLSTDSQKVLAKLQFPNIDFFLVETSSSRIQTIWENR
jgi:hypothetical protein